MSCTGPRYDAEYGKSAIMLTCRKSCRCIDSSRTLAAEKLAKSLVQHDAPSTKLSNIVDDEIAFARQHLHN